MSTLITRKFLESMSDVVDIISTEGCDCNPVFFLTSSLATVVVTSFTSNPLVILTSLTTSFVLLGVSKRLRTSLERLASASVYVLAFSLIALLPFLLNGEANLYLLYVFRALGATLLLLTSTSTLGWRGLSNAMQRLRIPIMTSLVTMYVRLISTLMRDTSRMLLGREARILRRSELRDLPTYATAVGDLILRSEERGRRAALAVEARTLSPAEDSLNLSTSSKLTKLDAIIFSAAVTEVLLQLFTEV
ncbi:MAG: hypothetical protein QXP80_02210 [Zestosphaera sp.]